MPDIINILPDSVANQIAAGEVIQRPASAVKELLENALDAGATDIQLIIKDAGKTLIQVSDNGSGMSESDARLCFERHATSKIHEAKDLFKIISLGFRGEALASIAAIAHVEMRTKKTGENIGTSIIIEGSNFKLQEPCQCEEGTTFYIKNLFFNVPARRNFLKTDSSETGHIFDEFFRVALAHPNVAMTLNANGKTIHILEKSSLKQRIVSLFGNQYNERLFPVKLNTDDVSIEGFVGKPEHARKTRGEQFFFVNKRFIKNPYLHHAIEIAFQGLLAEKAFPSYFIFIDLDPETIDINIHPTKTEINFQNANVLYSMLRSAVKQALGMYSVAPQLDFGINANLVPHLPDKNFVPKQPQIRINPDYNPFDKGGNKNEASRNNISSWEKLYEGFEKPKTDISSHNDDFFKQVLIENIPETDKETNINNDTFQDITIFQLDRKYIISPISSGLLIIDQQRAHEHILYEQFIKQQQNNKFATQQLLFPQNIHLNISDCQIMENIIPDLKRIGFDVENFGNETYIIHGLPAELNNCDSKEIIDSIIEYYKINGISKGEERNNDMSLLLARNLSIKHGEEMQIEEMKQLMSMLFNCQNPSINFENKAVYKIVTSNEICDFFN